MSKITDMRFPKKAPTNVVTQSMLTSFESCPRKTLFHHNLLTTPTKASPAIRRGNAWHELCEEWFVPGFGKKSFSIKRFTVEELEAVAGAHLDEEKEPVEFDSVIALALVYQEYILPELSKKWWVVAPPEQTFEWNYRGYNLSGKLDSVWRNKASKKIYVEDHKTKSKFNENELLQHLKMEIQGQYYRLSACNMYGTDVSGFVKSVIRFPGLRKGKDTRKEFYERMYKDIQKRQDFYFQLYIHEYTERQNSEFIFWLDNTLYDYGLTVINKKPCIPRRSSCLSGFGACKFLPYCSSDEAAGLIKKEKLNNEL